MTRENTAALVAKILVEHLGVMPGRVTEDARLDDLGADSLDVVELAMAFEEEFRIDIPSEAEERFATVKDVIDYIDGRLA